MLPCLRSLLRPALSLRAGAGLSRAGPGPGPSGLSRAPAAASGLWAQQQQQQQQPQQQRRQLGTHPLKEPVEPLTSPQGAKEFIYSLHPSERTCLLRELHKFESIAIAQGQLEIAPPTSAQLRYVLLHNAIPFVGFGFLDNCIMIVAGTHIELSIGVVFGISTMAAAALGNLVSDLAGLGLAGYVEALASRLGMQSPDLSPKQADMWQTRVSAHSGKAVGVGIGCILGMFPLLFYKDDDEKKDGQKEAKEEAQEEAQEETQEETQSPAAPADGSKN